MTLRLACGSAPAFQIAFLFHENLDLLRRTLPICLDALTADTQESFEVVLHADGSADQIAEQLPALCAEWGIDELRVRRRDRHVASGDPSNNGHRRLFNTSSPYLVVIEDDVVVFRTDSSFDPLRSMRLLLERHSDVPVVFTIADAWQWSWQLEDVGREIEDGVRSVNRVSTHMIGYAVDRFVRPATRFGGFEPDVFIDRQDLSYNWEDLVSHVGTTGGRRIAFPGQWPLKVFHCDRKVADGSIHHTRDPQIKHAVLDEIESQFAGVPAIESGALA